MWKTGFRFSVLGFSLKNPMNLRSSASYLLRLPINGFTISPLNKNEVFLKNCLSFLSEVAAFGGVFLSKNRNGLD
jgi:hypothetical protein